MKGYLKTVLLIFLLCHAFPVEGIFQACAAESENIPAPTPVQVSGRVAFGPFEITPPPGFWYFTRDYAQCGPVKHVICVITFFHTKEDIPGREDKTHLFPDYPFYNFYVFPGRFNDLDSYYDMLAKTRKSRGVPDDEFTYRDLPDATKALFQQMGDWSCKEEFTKPPRPLFSINCIKLTDIGVVQLSLHGKEEKDVLMRAPILKSMMVSLKGGKLPKSAD